MLISAVLCVPSSLGQGAPASADSGDKSGDKSSPKSTPPAAAATSLDPLIPLHIASTKNLTSELGGAFMPPVKCDADGNLYIRKFAMNRPRGPVIKIDAEGKPATVFDPAAFSALALDRVDAFSPASDGGIYQIAESRRAAPGGQSAPEGVSRPRVYVLHYSSDGTPASPAKLDADFEVYTFAAFDDGDFLVSGVQRDPLNKNDHGRGVTKIFSADGTELAQLTFQEPKKKGKTASTTTTATAAPGAKAAATDAVSPAIDATPGPPKPAGALDLKDAEAGRDGNLYVMRTTSQALVDVIAPGGKIMKTLKIAPPVTGAVPVSFHVSENRLAILFSNREAPSGNNNEQPAGMAILIADAQTGRRIAAYSSATDFGSFACYSANDGAFTFLKHGEGNVMEVVRAEP